MNRINFDLFKRSAMQFFATFHNVRRTLDYFLLCQQRSRIKRRFFRNRTKLNEMRINGTEERWKVNPWSVTQSTNVLRFSPSFCLHCKILAWIGHFITQCIPYVWSNFELHILLLCIDVNWWKPWAENLVRKSLTLGTSIIDVIVNQTLEEQKLKMIQTKYSFFLNSNLYFGQPLYVYPAPSHALNCPTPNMSHN